MSVVPVVGTGVLDLARAQGRAVVAERRAQLLGDTAHVHGSTGVEHWDSFARHVGLAALARRCHARLDPETRTFVDAYAGGVAEALGQEWEPWTPLGIFAVNHVLFSTFPTKLWRRHATGLVGGEIVALLSAEPVGSAGSNAFAVGGALTASGLPLVAGDPHRLFEDPNCYHQVHLVCEEFDVTGFTFPGVPGVQHFAHAGEVAWGITNAMADYQDVELDGAGGFTLTAPAFELDDLGFGALLPLLRSRSVADVLDAFECWVEPVNNLVVADRAGRVARQVVGRVPGRAELPTVELPGAEVAPGELVVTANQRMDGFDVLGDEFAPPYRAERIAELLHGRSGLVAADLAAVLRDTRRPVTRLVRLVTELSGLSPAATALVRRQRGWAGFVEPGSTEAAEHLAVRDCVVRRLSELPALRALDVRSPYGPLLDPWFALGTRVLHALDNLLGAGDVLGFDPAELVAGAVEEVAAGPAPRPPEIPGDLDAVCSVSGPPGARPVRGPVARYVWDLADRSAGGWAIPVNRVIGDLDALPPYPAEERC